MSVNIDELSVPREIATELRRLSLTYEILELVPKGANGYLFKARNLVLGRTVAIKFYYWELGSRAHLEPALLAAVRSPGIIEILEASIVGAQWAMFVTPFYESGDLDTFLQRNPVSLHDASRMVEAVLEGLAALHGSRLVHRDLKPENILVSEHGRALIADFGSVRRIPDADDSVPGSGHSVLYRPPESFASGTYDRRGDTYQCGIVLFQALGGQVYYDGTQYLSKEELKQYAVTSDSVERTSLVDAAIARRATAGTLCDVRTLPYYVSARFKQVIRKSLAPNPNERFQNAGDMLIAIQAARAASPNWINEKSGPIAIGGPHRYRIARGAKGKATVEVDTGKGWRRLAGTSPASPAVCLRVVADRCR